MLPINLLLLLIAAVAAAAGDDMACLRGFKSSISDPAGSLLDWNLSNSTAGSICHMKGVSCWNDQENRILSLNLGGLSLSGSIPSALRNCTSLNNLDLSGNSLAGPIPSDLCSWVPFVVTLDLSSNSFSSSIPPSLSDCSFLNKLSLASNHLSGPIPPSLSRLDRLKSLDLSSNDLSGQIPPPLAAKFDESSFAGNPSLCGRPLSSSCGNSLSKTSLIIIIAAGVFGAAVSLIVAYAVWRFCFSPKALAAKKKKQKQSKDAAGKGDGRSVEEGRWWSDRLRSSNNRLVPVSLFQKPIVKVRLADLAAATAGFHRDHVVVSGSSRIGTSYEAVLPDGSALTVKILHNCPLLEKQFRVEMGNIGQIRHPNLVPLLGYCVVEEERLLIYKHMANGALSSLIQSGDEGLDWPTRLSIGIGGARGLAWLHHGFQVPLLHQNVSSSAVLLDDDYEPRITDFGVARLLRPWTMDGLNTTPFLNGDFGEFGYVAPEYASNPVPSTKGDVYGFGVVLLELATGQKAVEVSSDVAGEGFKGNLVDWVTQLFAGGRAYEAIDRSLRGKGHDNQILEFLKVACGCVVVRPQERLSMYKVYQSLKRIRGGHEHSEQVDEFPLLYGKDDSDAA